MFVVVAAFSFQAFGSEMSASSLKRGLVPKRIRSVRTLLEDSSLARRIKESGNEEAEAVRQEAIELFDKAVEAHETGDDQKSMVFLVEAQKTLFRGVKLLGGGDSSEKKKRRDFEHRLKSVRALLEAQKRVKGEGEGDEISELIKEARARYEAGEIDKGREILDKAYEISTSTLKSARKGKTKVRSIKFDNKKDEYEFVKKFNDDYINLAEKFLKEYLKDAEVSKKAERMRNFFLKGKQLRAKADEMAAAEDYDGAIKTMDASTREIKSAIRLAGFRIF